MACVAVSNATMRWILAGAVGVLASQQPCVARAQTPDECASSYVGAQRSRKKGELGAAHTELLVCSAQACAPTLRQDCIRWLAEVDASMPSVVFAVHGPSGGDVTDVKVAMDGAPLLDRVGGAAVPVDPGSHTFRFEMIGAAPTEQRVVVREGEKARVISVSFAATAPTPPEAGGRSRGVPLWLDATIGGAGVVLLGLGATFEVMGFVKKGQLDSCYGHCGTAAVDDAHRNFVTGDVLVSLGLVALAAGAYLYFFHR